MTRTALPPAKFRQPEIWSQAFRLAKIMAALLVVSLVLNLALAVLAIALAGRPADVVLVDKLGKATFFVEAANQTSPQDFEAEDFARRWAESFLSLDSVTAKDDLARALSQAHTDLQAKLRAQLVDSGVLDKVRDAYVRSTVHFDRVAISERAEDRFAVQLEGQRTLMAMGAQQKTITEPVKLELLLAKVPRTKSTPNGLIVRYVGGTFSAGPAQ
ncbi:MAG: hypothetical protein IT381_27725 [Deltaproteobacteria bacterium]|nr:hypothetical protein [Deltaproteobacteria bacterium]